MTPGYTFRQRIGIVMRKMASRSWVRACFQRVAMFLRKNAERFDFVAGHPELPLPAQTSQTVWTPPQLPQWVMDEMLKLSKIESDLILTPMGGRKKFDFYGIPDHAEPGKAFAEAWKKLDGRKFTHVLIGPWLVRGGADLGTLHHIDRLVEMPDVNVLLIVTENADSPWMERVDPRATALELGKICGKLNLDDTVFVLTRLILQLRPDVIHLINSYAGWEMVEKYGRAVAQTSKIYASLYCDEYTPDGLVAGYARNYLRTCSVYLGKIISDNRIFPDIWSREIGVYREKFAVVHFPANQTGVSVFAPEAGVRRVLWAGRFTKQKNPVLLAEIARRTPDIWYDVYGTDSADGIEFTENVVLKGGFDNFAELPHHQYGCYLNTSLWDGLPNVLLEATVAGLPVVSTDVGGIRDFLDEENSFLITDVSDVDAICQQINHVLSDQETARQRWQRAYGYICSRHSVESMRAELLAIDGYFDQSMDNACEKNHWMKCPLPPPPPPPPFISSISRRH